MKSVIKITRKFYLLSLLFWICIIFGCKTVSKIEDKEILKVSNFEEKIMGKWESGLNDGNYHEKVITEYLSMNLFKQEVLVKSNNPKASCTFKLEGKYEIIKQKLTYNYLENGDFNCEPKELEKVLVEIFYTQGFKDGINDIILIKKDTMIQEETTTKIRTTMVKLN